MTEDPRNHPGIIIVYVCFFGLGFVLGAVIF